MVHGSGSMQDDRAVDAAALALEPRELVCYPSDVLVRGGVARLREPVALYFT